MKIVNTGVIAPYNIHVFPSFNPAFTIRRGAIAERTLGFSRLHMRNISGKPCYFGILLHDKYAYLCYSSA